MEENQPMKFTRWGCHASLRTASRVPRPKKSRRSSLLSSNVPSASVGLGCPTKYSSLSMKYTCMRAVGMEPTLISNWWSQLFTIRFIPLRRITSCSWCLRSLILLNFGMKTLMSRPISCTFAGR